MSREEAMKGRNPHGALGSGLGTVPPPDCAHALGAPSVPQFPRWRNGMKNPISLGCEDRMRWGQGQDLKHEVLCDCELG